MVFIVWGHNDHAIVRQELHGACSGACPMTSQDTPELVERVAWVAPMTTLADEIARAAVEAARGRFVSFRCSFDDPPQLWAERWSGDTADNVAAGYVVGYARGLLDYRSTMPLQAPRKTPQQPQAPEGAMMGEFW